MAVGPFIVLERLDYDGGQLRRMLLAKWLLNEGRQKLPTHSGALEGKFGPNPQSNSPLSNIIPDSCNYAN